MELSMIYVWPYGWEMLYSAIFIQVFRGQQASAITVPKYGTGISLEEWVHESQLIQCYYIKLRLTARNIPADRTVLFPKPVVTDRLHCKWPVTPVQTLRVNTVHNNSALSHVISTSNPTTALQTVFHLAQNASLSSCSCAKPAAFHKVMHCRRAAW